MITFLRIKKLFYINENYLYFVFKKEKLKRELDLKISLHALNNKDILLDLKRSNYEEFKLLNRSKNKCQIVLFKIANNFVGHLFYSLNNKQTKYVDGILSNFNNSNKIILGQIYVTKNNRKKGIAYEALRLFVNGNDKKSCFTCQSSNNSRILFRKIFKYEMKIKYLKILFLNFLHIYKI